jgi:hypothetical protein
MNTAKITIYEVMYGESLDNVASKIIAGNYETLKAFRKQWRHVSVVSVTDVEVRKEMHGQIEFHTIHGD